MPKKPRPHPLLSGRKEPKEDEEFILIYDITEKKPGCVLLQSAMNGTLPYFNELFIDRAWLTSRTPGMKAYRVTWSQAKSIAAHSVQRP